MSTKPAMTQPERIRARARCLFLDTRPSERPPIYADPDMSADNARNYAMEHYGGDEARLEGPSDRLIRVKVEIAESAGALVNALTIYGLTWEECNDLCEYEVTETVAMIAPDLRLKPGKRHTSARSRLGAAPTVCQIVRLAEIRAVADDLIYASRTRIAAHQEDVREWLDHAYQDLEALSRLRRGPLEASIVALRRDLRALITRTIHACDKPARTKVQAQLPAQVHETPRVADDLFVRIGMPVALVDSENEVDEMDLVELTALRA